VAAGDLFGGRWQTAGDGIRLAQRHFTSTGPRVFIGTDDVVPLRWETHMNLFRPSVAFMLLISLAAAPLSSTALAAQEQSSLPRSIATSPTPLKLPTSLQPAGQANLPTDFLVQPSFAAMASSAAAVQRGRYRGGRRSGGGGRRTAAAEALVFGAAAAITGAAVLAYANRPDCDYDPRLSGCGYGTKVVGTSVLAGGVVGVLVGAALWR
jgi:hypothetical protein